MQLNVGPSRRLTIRLLQSVVPSLILSQRLSFLPKWHATPTYSNPSGWWKKARGVPQGAHQGCCGGPLRLRSC